MRGSVQLLLLMTLGTRAACQTMELRLASWTAVIEPETLTVRARIDGQKHELLAAAGARNAVEPVSRTPRAATWKIPSAHLTTEFTVRGNRLHVRFTSASEQSLDWPRTGDDGPMAALILPEGEGLFIPRRDPAWRERLRDHCFSASGQLSMPFWSYQIEGRTFTYQVLSDIRTDLCLEERDGRLVAFGRHSFLDRDQRPVYELEMWTGGASPIAPAIEYREELVRTGKFVTLADKIRINPEVAKLLGAVHMYVWGTGRTPEFIDDLQHSGIHRAWIGYDQDERTHTALVGAAYVAAARRAGYLVGPYDTFSNAQDPVTGEDSVSMWPGDLYPAGCIRDKHLKPLHGFAGRGCELSSEALRRAEATLKPMESRVDQRLRDKPNSYFLDVDAFGDLYDDYAPAHPMTPFRDRLNRLERMQMIRARGLVLGSEEGAGWSVPAIDFAHGAFSVQNAVLWGKKKEFGAWWPPERPQIFFKTVDVNQEFIRVKYDPAYRLPLYEAAYHDAIVATDRWDVPMAKFPELSKTRQLLELLYGVPSMWAMDRKQLKDSGAALTKLTAFFEPLHRRTGAQPLTDFKWLTNDRLAQQTTFGNEAVVTANFGSAAFAELKPGCIRVRWIAAKQEMTFCPA